MQMNIRIDTEMIIVAALFVCACCRGTFGIDTREYCRGCCGWDYVIVVVVVNEWKLIFQLGVDPTANAGELL